MHSMAKQTNPWPGRLKKLQKRLDKSNVEMAELLGITLRCWHAWKYGERQPQTGSVTLIRIIEEKAK